MRRMLLAIVGAVCLSSCTNYYYQNNLNRLSPGVSEDQFLQAFPTKHGFNTTSGAVVRASKMVGAERLDVVTVPLSLDGVNDATEYWFVFRDRKLVQWGKPDDWRSVAATYQIDFNPVPAVRTP